MPKVRAPLFSLGAQGSVGGVLSYRKRGDMTVAEKRPVVPDARSRAQLYHRWDYQDYALMWNLLSQADKDVWVALAKGQNVTGFNLWLRDRLSTLPDLVGRWRLDEIVGGKVLDSSKNSNDGIVYGATPADGVFWGCLSFDGLDDYVGVADSASLRPATGLTMAAWVNPAEQKFALIVLKGSSVAWMMWMGLVGYKGRMGVKVDGGWVYMVDGEPGTTILLETWSHVVGVWDGAEMRTYFNGALDNSKAAVGTLAGAVGTDVSIGILPPTTTGWKGRLDEVVIENRALSGDEVLQRYERGKERL